MKSIACPKCRKYMFPSRQQGVQIDCCSGCEGIWLDQGELGQLAHTPQDLPCSDALTPTGLSCPRCGGGLAARPYLTGESLEVDYCQRCHGVYLDKDELGQITGLADKVATAFPAAYQARMASQARWNETVSAIYKNDSPAAKRPAEDRGAFISKVYQLLVLTLLVTAASAHYGVTSGLAAQMFGPALGAEFSVFLIALLVRRVPIVNMIFLFGYTALSGFTLSAVLVRYLQAGMANVVWSAALMTAVVFVVLSVYVHVTKRDFEWMGGFLFAALTLLILSGFTMALLGSSAGSWVLWSSISALVFCGFILFDTSQIILKYDTDEVVSAVLELYLDIINLFLDLLRILSALRN